MGQTKLNWVLFSYNGNDTVARFIYQAYESSVREFIDLGGNGVDEEEFHFAGPEDCQLICIGSDPHFMMSELSLCKVAWFADGEERWANIRDLPAWLMDKNELVVRDYSERG